MNSTYNSTTKFKTYLLKIKLLTLICSMAPIPTLSLPFLSTIILIIQLMEEELKSDSKLQFQTRLFSNLENGVDDVLIEKISINPLH